MKLLLALLLSASIAQAQTCPTRIQLKAMPSTSRGGTIIYKSNWNKEECREQNYLEGNHANKGVALLVHYKAIKYLPTSSAIEVRTLDCEPLLKMYRYPRCTADGCGDYERWYSRSIYKLGDVPVLIRLKGRLWAQVNSIYNNREIAR